MNALKKKSGSKFDKDELAIKLKLNLKKRLNVAEEKVQAEREIRDNDSCLSLICEFSLILWDGSGFFGLRTSKLERIRGKAVGWCTTMTDA